MNPNIAKNYKLINDIRGDPQEYKGVKFYPLRVGDIEYKESFYRLFCWPKNYIPNKEILKSSYVKYLLMVIAPKLKQDDPDIDIYKEFIKFLCFIVHLEIPSIEDIDGGKSKVRIIVYGNDPNKSGTLEGYNFKIFINNVEFDEYDFDNVREIILEQNGTSIEWVEGFEPDLEEKLNVFNNNSDIDLKDIIYSFCVLTNLSEEEACNKTLFQFNARFEREIKLKDYQAFKPLEVSGQISSKNKKDDLIKHYLSHMPMKGRYDDILLNLNTFMEDSGLSNPDGGLRME